MRPFLIASIALLAAACSPTFNWRDTAVGPTGLHATFPCKPEPAEHKTAFAPGVEVTLHAISCEAGGASYAIVYGDIGDGADPRIALESWKQASLATLKAKVKSDKPYTLAGTLRQPPPAMVIADGQRADGGALQSQAAYFLHGTSVFQAAVHAPQLKPEMTETFFAGLRFE